MSALADAARSKRQVQAASGSAHDRLVRALQILLPAAVGALIAVLLFAPFSHRGEVSFLLAKDAIEVTGHRLSASQARYSGNDAAGRPFAISAASAIQRSAADPVVRMTGLNAAITMTDGPATLAAGHGSYDPTHETVRVDGPLQFAAADGYRLDTGDVSIDLNQRRLTSGRAVAGQLPIGRFSADRLDVNLETRIVRLSGNARLRINQGVVR